MSQNRRKACHWQTTGLQLHLQYSLTLGLFPLAVDVGFVVLCSFLLGREMVRACWGALLPPGQHFGNCCSAQLGIPDLRCERLDSQVPSLRIPLTNATSNSVLQVLSFWSFWSCSFGAKTGNDTQATESKAASRNLAPIEAVSMHAAQT